MKDNSESRSKSALSRVGSVLVSGVVVAVSALLVVSGTAFLGRSNADSPAPAQMLTPVSVMQVSILPGYAVERRFTGQIEASAQTDLGFEVGGRVLQVLVEEGSTVASGDVLARLDVSALIPEKAALEAELAALKADAELATLNLARISSLTTSGARSVASQDEARLGLRRIEARSQVVLAQLASLEVRLDKSTLIAPFDAKIGARYADPGQTLGSGQPVLVLFSTASPRLRVGVPPELADAMSVGQEVKLAAGLQSASATISSIRPELDPATRSRTILVDVPSDLQASLGTTAELVLSQEIEDPGFWAPLSALREGARGSWTVMAIASDTQGDTAVLAAVEVLHTDGANVFLRSQLPPDLTIISSAPDRVAPQQRVDTRGANEPKE